MQEAAGKEADEAAGESVPQARIIAYSDSDSDDPAMPTLPFRRRRADEGSDSDNNAESTSGDSESRGLFAWRGWNRLEKPAQANFFWTRSELALELAQLHSCGLVLAMLSAFHE